MAFQLQPVIIGNNADTDYKNMNLDNFLNFLKQGNNGFGVYGLPKEEQLSDEQIKSIINNGINNGNKYISEWQTANNIRKPQDEEEIEQARTGVFNTPALSTALTQEQEQPRRNSFLEGYRDNYNNSFSFSNLRNNPDKNWQYRLGEGLGTVGRFIDSPLGRGVIAAGLNKALGYDNSALEGLQAFGTRQNNVTADRLYRNELKKYGYTDDDLAGIRGTITSDMFKNLSNNAYRSQKLTQDQAMKQLNAIRQLHSAGQIDNNTASMAITKILQNTEMGDMGEFNFQDSNQTRNTNSQIEYINQKLATDSIKLQQNQERINILNRRLAMGIASQSQIAELRALNIENKKLEQDILRDYLNNNGGNNNPTPARKVGEAAPKKETPKPQAKPAQKTNTTGKTGTTKNGTKYRVIE